MDPACGDDMDPAWSDKGMWHSYTKSQDSVTLNLLFSPCSVKRKKCMHWVLAVSHHGKV